MRIGRVTLALAAGLLFAPATAAAQFCLSQEEQQDNNAMAACLAATTTPFGALSTQIPANWIGRSVTGIGVNFRFGSMDEEGDAGRRNFGIGVDIPLGRATIGITGGYIDYTCDVPGEDINCKSAIMAGGQLATPLLVNPIGTGDSGQSFILGLTASLGFSTGDVIDGTIFGETFELSARGLSVGVGFPLALVARSGSITITPYIEPAVFWGQTKLDASGSFGADEQTESGTGFALGGGISFGLASGLSFDVGIKKVMMDEAKSLIGLGISFQR